MPLTRQLLRLLPAAALIAAACDAPTPPTAPDAAAPPPALDISHGTNGGLQLVGSAEYLTDAYWATYCWFDVTYNRTNCGEYPADGLRMPWRTWLGGIPVNSASAAWKPVKQHLADGFESTFEFRMQGGGTNGADGFAFVIQDASGSAIGGLGVGLGYDGIPRSLALEFDTYHNGGADPNANHVAIHSLGGSSNRTIPIEARLAATAAVPDLNNAAWHRVHVRYRPGAFEVWLDDAYILNANVNLTNIRGSSILDAEGKAWVGFTAGTGSLTQFHDIIRWQLTELTDSDHDGVPDRYDNCKDFANADQADRDSDGVGDSCDNAPDRNNPTQADVDADGVADVLDNCRLVANAGQEDGDLDGVGDACDNAPNVPNADQRDTDADGRADVIDNCSAVSNADQADRDGDGLGDACDANQVPAAHAGGPYTGTEGGMVSFAGSSASDPEGDALSYAWDFDGDGVFEASGTSVSRSFPDNGTYTVRFRVTDVLGAASVASATVTIADATPVITKLYLPYPALNAPPAGVPWTLEVAFDDKGATDGPWQYTFDWGDGTTPTVATTEVRGRVQATHAYATPGSRTVLVRVRDKDGATASRTIPVSVR